MLAKECPKAIPVLGLEPRVFRLEGGRAIQLRHTGKILSVERFELSHPEISRPKRDALDRSAKLTKTSCARFELALPMEMKLAVSRLNRSANTTKNAVGRI